MTLYTRSGSYPAGLPQDITLTNGFIRTDPASFTPEEIADAGYIEAPAQPAYDGETERLEWDGEGWEVVPLPRPKEIAIVAERARRLALGFDYDFGDERGVHHIGTTEADMRKWLDEVTPISQALINAGMSTGEIGIFTDTGPVTVTAAEWQVILLAAGQWRQPIYQASFALLTADPIPYDYTANAHWL